MRKGNLQEVFRNERVVRRTIRGIEMCFHGLPLRLDRISQDYPSKGIIDRLSEKCR